MDPPRIVLGLGNPGLRYRTTRHNVGFRVVDGLAEHWGGRFGSADDLRGKAWTAEVSTATGPLILAKPRTYMNCSGRAARALCRLLAAPTEQLLVVYDDADLALGRIRIRSEGGAGGHNGVRSLMDALGSGGFPRVRLGVRGESRVERELADYVLEPFEEQERPAAETLVRLGIEAVVSVVDEGLQAAMNSFNVRSSATEEDETDRT